MWCDLIARGGGVLGQQERCGVVVNPYHQLDLLVGGVFLLRVGTMIPSLTPIGESGEVNMLDLLLGRTSGGTRSHGSSKLSVPTS